jgi:hypothetical protein
MADGKKRTKAPPTLAQCMSARESPAALGAERRSRVACRLRVAQISSVLVANRVSFELRHAEIQPLLRKLSGVLESSK